MQSEVVIFTISEFAKLIGIHKDTIYKNKSRYENLSLRYIPDVGWRFLFKNTKHLYEVLESASTSYKINIKNNARNKFKKHME